MYVCELSKFVAGARELVIIKRKESLMQVVEQANSYDVKPGLHWVVWVPKVVQKDAKDKDSQLESFVF